MKRLVDTQLVVRVSTVFVVQNDNEAGNTTPHAVEVKCKGKDAIIEALARTRLAIHKVLKEE